jgi:hypothetical protein
MISTASRSWSLDAHLTAATIASTVVRLFALVLATVRVKYPIEQTMSLLQPPP